MAKQLEQQVQQLLARRESGLAACDVSSSSVRVLKVPLAAQRALQLKALAMVLDGSDDCLGGQLLNAAVADIWDGLDGGLRAEAEAAYRIVEKGGAAEATAGVEFDLGCS